MDNEQSRILIVEDEEATRKLLSVTLEHQGYKLYVATNPANALELIGNTAPHLIICEMVMPQMDGLKLRDEVRKRPRTDHVPFIFLSNRTQASQFIHKLDLDIDDYLTNPFDPRELVARVKSSLSRFNRYQYLIKYDGLTNMWKAEAFQEKINEDLKRSSRYQKPLTTALVALDDFPNIISVYGESFGLELLNALASIILIEIREVDYAGRVGEDKIVVAMPETPKEQSQIACERIRNAVTTLVFPDDGLKASVSIGLASAPDDGEEFDSLLSRAQASLNKAQQQGGNSVSG